MSPTRSLTAALAAAFVVATPFVLAHTAAGDADDKVREQQLADKAQQMHNERLNACRQKAREQMVDGPYIRVFIQTCMEQSTMRDAKK